MADYCAWDHKDWAAAGLKNYEDFADMIEYVNQSEYGDGQLEGEWWYADDATRTVYYGSFGNDNSPGASSYTYADTFPDDPEGYAEAVKKWESYDEYLPHEDDCKCESCEEDREQDEEGCKHDYGPIERGRFTGTEYRKCSLCGEITLDLCDEDKEEE